MTRRAFERANEEQTAALIAQFRREFSRRGDEVAHRVETIAASEAATRMALAVSRGSTDYSAFVNEAKSSGRQPATGFSGVRGRSRHDSLVGAVAGEIRLQGKFPCRAAAPSQRMLFSGRKNFRTARR